MKYWIIVASKDHVQTAKEGGFCQVCHGKKWPLTKMSTGDGVLFYSSKEEFGSSKSYQKFTAIGEIKDDAINQVTMNSNFEPYRKDVRFLDCQETEIRPLLQKLNFVENTKNWGYKLMNGFLEIDSHDFDLISCKMLENYCVR